MRTRSARLLILLTLATTALHAQDLQPYSRRNTFSIFTEYSNTSSHILLGISQNRRLTALGLTYSRRLLHTRYADWNYNLELRPLNFIQEPTVAFRDSAGSVIAPNPIQRTCTSGTFKIPGNPGSGFPGYTYTQTCGTRWTYAGGLSPLGQRINIAPRHRLQPFVVSNAGFLAATRDIPVNNSSRFNFTFEFGAGLELFHDHRHSWSAEYRIHHISNAYTGTNNPGIDNQILKLTYSFGR